MLTIEGTYNDAKVFADEIDDGAGEQIARLCSCPAFAGSKIRMMSDVHAGKGCCIGTTMTITDKIVPQLVGVDVGCGVLAVKLDAGHIDGRLLDEIIEKRIPTGMKVHSEIPPMSYMMHARLLSVKAPVNVDYALRSLGTLGGGNHFIELQKTTLLRGADDGHAGRVPLPDAESRVWLMIHSGSRNLGKRIEEHYHRIANRLCTRFHVPLADPDLAFLPIEEPDGHNYYTDMLFALRYAKENRRRMMEAMKETVAEFVPEANFIRTIDIHHNYAACEDHFGKKVFVHRKGATSAKPGEIGVIPGSMGTASYIVRGLGNPESFMSCSHGAGRRMSRMAASTTLTVEECDRAMDGIVCERWHKYRGFGKAKGNLDLSEAPQAYKDIEDVIASERDLVEPLVRLVPLASLKG